METRYTILRADGTSADGFVDWPEEPKLDHIKSLVEPIVGGWPERVRVLCDGNYTDMFVHDDGWAIGLRRNAAATAIYRANWLAQHPKTNPDSLPAIAGDAVLFGRRVWF